jgi:AcrR family transcriptional regulator
MTTDTGRPLRADARRNREKILAAAVRVFAEHGLDVRIHLIAEEAGVGTGTLYRNFPTRENLIEAAYRQELSRLCEAAPELLAAMPPHAALRSWMGHFLDYARVQRGMADALHAVIDSDVDRCVSRELMVTALTSLVDAAAADGTIRPDIGAADVLVALTGVALAAGRPEQRAQAERLLDLILGGCAAA